MAEFFTVLSAVQTTCSILSSFAQVIGRYRALSEQLYDAREELAGAAVDLDYWRCFWRVRQGRHEAYYIMIFGATGWNEIRRRLGSIKQIMEEVNTMTDDITRKALPQSRSRGSNIYNDRYDPVMAKDAVRRISKSMSKRSAFYWALRDKGTDMQNQLRRLDRKMISLDRFSKHCAESLWPGTFGPITDISWKKHNVIAAPTAEDGKKVQAQAKDLHEAYEAGKMLQYAIGLTTPRSPGRGTGLTTIELVYGANSQAKEVVIKPEELEYNACANNDLYTAITSLGVSGKKEAYLLPPNASSDRGLIIASSKQRLLSQVMTKDNLAQRMQQSRDLGGDKRLLFEDRMAMVTALTDGVFRLQSSDWLDDLDTLNSKGGRGREDIWKMILLSRAGDRNVATQLDKIKSSAAQTRSKRDLTRHCHIFRLALVITELLLDVRISQLRKKDDRLVVDLFIRDIQDEALTADDVADRVQEGTRNETLSNLVYECLATLMENAYVQDEKIDERFYAKAFMPTHVMSNALIRKRRQGQI